VTLVVGSFLVFVAGFAAIGLLSVRRRASTTEDYLVAGRSVPPWLTALSSAATNNSGFMFIGLVAR
jgi:sodium/proline symporter